jgi:hypothetical protein
VQQVPKYTPSRTSATWRRALLWTYDRFVPGPTAETIRDALGLVRLLYSTRQGAGGEALEQLEAVGKELRTALDLSKYEEGSLGAKACLERAEKALDMLEKLVAGDLLELVKGARQRLRKGKVRPSRPDRPAAA